MRRLSYSITLLGAYSITLLGAYSITLLRAYSIIFLVTIFLSGCAKAVISSKSLGDSPTVLQNKLFFSKTSGVPLGLAVKGPDGTKSIGKQYGLVIAPLGRVSIERPSLLITDALLRELAVLGYSPQRLNQPESPPAEALPAIALKVSLDTPRLNAYDLLLIRRLNCSLSGTVGVSLHGTALPPQRVTLSVTQYDRFGFSRELNNLFYKCRKEFVQKLLKETQLLKPS